MKTHALNASDDAPARAAPRDLDCAHAAEIDRISANIRYAKTKGRMGAPTVRALTVQLDQLFSQCAHSCDEEPEQEATR